MTKQTEALKLALEALEVFAASYSDGNEAITAIKEALAPPEQSVQEPVAWGFRHHDGAIYDCISPEAHADCEGEYNVPLYDAPPKQEPRNFCPRCGKRTADLTAVHTCTPPEGGHQ